jgi:DHA2 family multidrug resistance protein
MKRVIMTSATVFVISSVLCGQATSLQEMVFFRIIQGIGGAFLPSVAQSYIHKNFIGKERISSIEQGNSFYYAKYSNIS